METVLLAVSGFEHQWPDTNRTEDSSVRFPSELQILPGQCVQLTGQSGAGKTTLALAAAGLLTGGASQGSISRFAPCGLGGIGVVLQNPDTQILSSQILDEVMLAPLALGQEPEQVHLRALRALEAVGLDQRQDDSTDALSMGQKYRLCIAALLVQEARLWILDEPFSQLDEAGKTMLTKELTAHLQRGGAALFTIHEPVCLPGIRTQEVHIGPASVTLPRPEFPQAESDGEPVIDLKDVFFSHDGRLPVLNGLNLRIETGERVVICGENGAGKSTLVALLSGMSRPDRGTVSVAGHAPPHPARLAGSVALVPQNPDFALTEERVVDEVAFCARAVHGKKAQDVALHWIRTLGMEHLADQPPLGLSFGQKRLVTLAAALASGPKVLLLDEPFTGLDQQRSVTVAHGLAAFQERHRESAIVCLTHEATPSELLSGRSLCLAGGRLE